MHSIIASTSPNSSDKYVKIVRPDTMTDVRTATLQLMCVNLQ